jgi:hypothetical protein
MTDKKGLERIGMIFALVTFAVTLNTVLVVRDVASRGEMNQPPFVAAGLVR